MSRTEINHFSHDHPLVLSEEKWNENFPCNVCGDAIFSLSYCCMICPFVLHKWCSELPQELSSHKHHLPHHPLILKYSSPSRCNICQIKSLCSAYTCSSINCSYNLHVECASFPDPLIKLSNYHHKFRKAEGRTWINANYRCPICRCPANDIMLVTTDPYEVYGRFLHVQCAMLPQTVKHRVHRHELTFRPPLKEDWYFEFFCDACEQERDPFQHVYYCEPCELVSHIGCGVTGSERPIQDILGTCPVYELPHSLEEETTEAETTEEEGGGEKVEIHEEGEDNKVGTFILNHPLVLYISMRAKEDICIICRQVIFGKAYACTQSDGQKRFYLHKWCAQLPKMVQNSRHCDHGILVLVAETMESAQYDVDDDTPLCDFCGIYLAGLYYECEKCNFQIHCMCALLPNNLNHQSHEHTLTAVMNRYPSESTYEKCKLPLTSPRKMPLCKACKFRCEDLSLECKDCNFSLHVLCFLLPYTGKHIAHRHNLNLTYEYKEDPRALEYICDTCEKPRIPNRWVYCCPEPDCYILSHVDCVVPKLVLPSEHHD